MHVADHVKQRDPANTETQSHVQALGRKCDVIACDAADRDSVTKAVGEALSRHEVSILLNAAGIQRRFNAEDFAFEAYDAVLRTNLDATFATCREVGAHWLNKGQKGVIINVGSLASFQGGVRMAAYAASKGGVLMLTKALSNEWSGRGIRVNSVIPGYIATDINLDVRTNPDPSLHESITSRIPMGRWGDADDLKGVAIFLASDASSYMSGESVVIDGGWMAR